MYIYTIKNAYTHGYIHIRVLYVTLSATGSDVQLGVKPLLKTAGISFHVENPSK